mmetsp:Transcript_84413/g.126550  ORF Transcript_84413/g.126550 Transcript_84413/m.126550 type:complete len:165 (-) Transcript_84413:106-600(-)
MRLEPCGVFEHKRNSFSVGHNGNGQLGLGHFDNQSSPCEIVGMEKIKLISCGTAHTTCVDEYGNLWTFGYNGTGQLGLGHSKERNSGNKVPGISNVKALSKGCTADFCVVQCEDNSLWVFGKNTFAWATLSVNFHLNRWMRNGKKSFQIPGNGNEAKVQEILLL